MELDILRECENAKRIGISGHVRPDGDCTGACLGLWQYLKKSLTSAEVTVYLEKPEDVFCGLKGYDEINSEFPEEQPFDVFFVLDCGADRIGGAEKYFRAAAKTINIDHHVSNPGTGDINYIRPQVGSVSELIYDLMEKDRVDRDMALAVYTGIIHDTGVFQYSNTSPDTMRKGAELIGYGFDFPRLILETFYQRTYRQTQILGRALVESVRYLDGRCVVSVIDRETMDFYGAEAEDLSGIVNMLRNIQGVSCAVFLYQSDEREYKVSLRTDERVNASKVAVSFGGGGHHRAAGCLLKGTAKECVDLVVRRVEEQLATC